MIKGSDVASQKAGNIREDHSLDATGRTLRERSARTVVFAGALLTAWLASAGCAGYAPFARRSAAESTRLLQEAERAREGGEAEQARKLLARAAQFAPDDPEAQRGIGKALVLAGEPEEGMAHIRYAMRHGVDDPDACVELAEVLLDAGRYGECRELIDDALRLVPTHVPAQYLKAKLAEVNHHDDEALEIYYRLLASDPTDTLAALRVANLLVRAERWNQAVPLLRLVVDSDRVSRAEQGDARWLLGLAYGRERRWTQAADELAAAAAMRPTISADEIYQIAYAYWEAGNRNKAVDYASLTLSVNPKHSDALALTQASRSQNATSRTAYSREPLPTPRGWD